MATARRLLTMRAYRQTPDGQAAAKRSHDTYVIKRRATNAQLKINSQPLMLALASWK